jgi:hypothetical protein
MTQKPRYPRGFCSQAKRWHWAPCTVCVRFCLACRTPSRRSHALRWRQRERDRTSGEPVGPTWPAGVPRRGLRGLFPAGNCDRLLVRSESGSLVGTAARTGGLKGLVHCLIVRWAWLAAGRAKRGGDGTVAGVAACAGVGVVGRGCSLHAIAREVGVARDNVTACVAGWGVRPAPRKRAERCLSLGEREEVSRGLAWRQASAPLTGSGRPVRARAPRRLET